MKTFLLLIFVLPIVSFSQCPQGGTFTSQAEIDDFAINYPDCTILNGSLIISGDDITDLSGLAQITECRSLSISNNLVLQTTAGLNPNLVLYYVEGEGNGFGIVNNASLIEVAGLENLQNQSGFESNFNISDNPLLISIAGVPDVFNALDFMYITNNNSLINLIGIENYSGGTLTSISENDALIDLTGWGNTSAEIVIIRNNAALQSLDGSENLWFDDYLYIEDNPNLTDISAIYAGSYNDDGLIIRNNPILSICSTDPVCFFLDSNGIEEGIWFPGTFENNAPGCNTNFEVEYGCELVSNDDCQYHSLYNPSSFLTFGETIQANNEYATTSSDSPSCDDIANRKDVWFVFDSGESTTVDIMTSEGFSLQLWDSNSEYLECHNKIQVQNACGSSQLLDVPVTQNNYYIVQVWDDGTGGGPGWFGVSVQDGALSVPEAELSDVKIFPNPANDILNIQSRFNVDKVSIYNMLGQNIHESTYNTNKVSVNISNLNKGMYTAIVSSDGRASAYKIIKQ